MRGVADGGDELYWLTAVEPDDWPVIAIRGREELRARFELPAIEVIRGLITGRAALPRFLPELDPDEAFEPIPRPDGG